IPFLFVFSLTLLMKGHPAAIALDVALAVTGVWFISAAMMGYSFRPLALSERLVYCVTGILTFMPANVLGAGRWFNVAGVALAIALFLHARLRKPPAALESS
ncbi:MAG: C4-dicarboxylate ABC transporter permease, partial [Betaproteobacteria bacterium]|nr:C4-dicarboxylate ABC transporter permease [Betaproteobacteria bacterium]